MQDEQAGGTSKDDVAAAWARQVPVLDADPRRPSAAPRVRAVWTFLIALLVHIAFLWIPLPAPREVALRDAPVISIELQALWPRQPMDVPEVLQVPAHEVEPEVEHAPMVAEPEPSPQRVSPPPPSPPPSLADPDPVAPAAPRLLAPDGRLRVAPLPQDGFASEAQADRVPQRLYGDVINLYPRVPVGYSATRFAAAYAPDGHLGQVAAFHYPVLNLLHIFPQLSWLIATAPSGRRTCMRDVTEVDDGICIDAGRNTLEWIRSRPIDR